MTLLGATVYLCTLKTYRPTCRICRQCRQSNNRRAYLNVSDKFIRRRIAEGKLRAWRIGRRAIRMDSALAPRPAHPLNPPREQSAPSPRLTGR